MAFKLEKVVPWVRSLDEYRRMFSLTDTDLSQRILGCADGPASFNAELTAGGGSVVSSDPLYTFSATEIRRQIDATYPMMIEQARQNADQFVWTSELPDAEALGRVRRFAMDRFLTDYDAGKQQARYIDAALPGQPFSDKQYDMAVCSHFLFLYSEQLFEQFHVDSIRSLLRIATQVRIFPLLGLRAAPSRHVEPVTVALRNDGYRVDIEPVGYEFQKGGKHMMRITQ